MIRLGPFELVEVIGRGGYGQVWSGVHGPSHTPVAVKVITAAAMRQPRARRALQAEVRAVARLKHPGVVRVFDLGEVSGEAERLSYGQLVAASPYLVMERVAGGTLGTRPPKTWTTLRGALLEVLAALAHAHARGVVHRDLKPGNVLLPGPDDGRPGLRLTDWGIAHVVGSEDEESDDGGAIGTLRYMAPEQIRGRARDQGPRTDLYGLGCLAWRLVSGRVPFEATSPTGIAHRQLYAEPPPLRPAMPLPQGFEAWLLRMLRKEPTDRYRHAADAAEALRSLPGDPSDAAPPRAPRPPRPTDWRPDPEADMGTPLAGVGLGLFGVRRLPVVGREAEQDALWGELLGVAEERRPRAVLLSGPAGVGKSRLAEWLCQRAHEEGVADQVLAAHGRPGSPFAGLGPMLAARFRTAGMKRSDVVDRLRERLDRQDAADPWEVAALTELVQPATPDEIREGAPSVRFASAAERHGLVTRQLAREAGDRPLVVWLDAVEQPGDTVAFVQRLMEEAPADCPLLLLLTTRTDSPADEALAEPCRVLLVGPLPEAAMGRLVRDLLGLEQGLAGRVGDRSGGIPLFAVQVVGDLAQRGVLEPTSDGFELTEGAELQLPGTLHRVLAARADEVLADWPDGCREALELGATLGAQVDADEWTEACRIGALPLPRGLVDSLLARGLLEPTDAGFAFPHRPLVESLRRSAAQAGRAPRQHRLCTRALRELHPAGTPGLAERMAEHQLAAGDREEALPSLLEAAKERRVRSEPDAALRLLDRRQGALAALGVGRRDRRWAAADVLRARVAGHATDFERVRLIAGRTLTDARREGWDDVAPEAARTLAFALWQLGERDLAEGLYAEALPQYAEAGHAEGVGRCHIGLGIAAAHRGDVDEAEERFTAAIEAFDDAGDQRGLADAYGWLGILASRRGDPERALAWYGRALPAAELIGHRLGVAMLRNSVAVVDRTAGRLDEAEAGFRAALELAEAIGSGEAVWPRINVAMLTLGRRDWGDARGHLDRCLEELEGRGRDELVGLVRAGRAVCAAATGDLPRCDVELSAAARALSGGSRLVTADLSQVVEIGVEILADHPRRAAALRAL